MIRPIMKSTLILSRPSAPATAQDASVAQDLLDTFAANRRGCAGMAANMIGILKRIIVVDCEGGCSYSFVNWEMLSVRPDRGMLTPSH